jgi:hypothetical protein
MLLSKFNSVHKIVSLDIMFDVMAFMLQVKMAMGFSNFNDVAIPNTLQTCQKQYDYPMVMTLAVRPYTIVQVNDRWENLTGYTGADVVGKHSCRILQGSDTGRKEIDDLMSPVLFQRPSCGMITNYTKNRRRYRSYITLYPLSTDSTVSHYFGLTTFVQWIDAEQKSETKMIQKHGKNDSGDTGSGSSKRPRELTSDSYKTKQARTDSKSTASSSSEKNNPAEKVITRAIHDKQSLSSLTSSMSSSSTTDKERGNEMSANDSVAAVAPSRSKPFSESVQKVEFSDPLSSVCPETLEVCETPDET